MNMVVLYGDKWSIADASDAKERGRMGVEIAHALLSG
jgi:hypothetical protein